MRPLIVGIGGVTNGGKTSLTRKLLAKFPSAATISQDDYFKEESPDLPRAPGLDHVNWDCFEALDMDRMMNDLRCLTSVLSSENQLRSIIIEGFSIMNYPPLAELIDLKYFLTLTKDVCRERRSNRVYNPPDPPGYFDVCVWPMYEIHYAHMQSIDANSKITFLDGEGDQNLHLKKVSQDINARLNLL